MPEKLQRRVIVWELFVKSFDILFMILFMIVLVFAFAYQSVLGRDYLGSLGLTLSVLVAYLTILRPFLRKPMLLPLIEENPIPSVSNLGQAPSWFCRLRILNYGFSPARNCVGRLTEIWIKKGERLIKFDPLTLYWARQDMLHTGYHPITIQGRRDFEYLDVAQCPPASQISVLRVVLPKGMALPWMPDDSPSPDTSPGLRPGTYYFRIGIYADDANFGPTWFEITFYDQPGDNVPRFQIKQKEPHFPN